jgi:hypothetical protein
MSRPFFVSVSIGIYPSFAANSPLNRHHKGTSISPQYPGDIQVPFWCTYDDVLMYYWSNSYHIATL